MATRTRFVLPLLFLAVLAWLPARAHADTAPRPSFSSSVSKVTSFG
jgi:hypothetical protein